MGHHDVERVAGIVRGPPDPSDELELRRIAARDEPGIERPDVDGERQQAGERRQEPLDAREGGAGRHTGVSGGSPFSTARTLLAARSAIAVRVSRVALPRCGASTTFSSDSSAGTI